MVKEAVVIIIDANETMAQPVRAEDPSVSRLDCAKQVAITMVSDLMIQSKTNEVTIVVLHTKESKNFLCTDFDENDSGNGDDSNIFSNMVEFSTNGDTMGIDRPRPALLRRIHSLQVTKGGNIRKAIGGDFVAGIVYATDALHQKTAGRKYHRRIVLFTDAEHEVTTDPKILLVALDSLRAMETRLEVVGMNFEYSEDFDGAAPGPTVKQEAPETSSPISSERTGGSEGGEADDGNATESDEEESDVEDDNEVGEEEDVLSIKRQNEMYLLSLANKTGGFVFAGKELHAMFDKILGRRVIIPSKRKLIFEIAPNKILDDARYYLLISKATQPPLKQKIVQVDENNQPVKNSLGVEMVEDMVTSILHKPSNNSDDDDISWDQIASAYRFGSDLLPFNEIDNAGLEQASPVKLTILGYMQTRQVPEYIRIGPPYVLSGDNSRRCCACISALARGLHRSNKVAICTFVKTKNKDPILCGLFPLERDTEPLHLLIMQLPFHGDLKEFHELKSLEDIAAKGSTKISKVCDDLIDSLMLPDDSMNYYQIPNPKIRSFYKTAINRVFDREAPVVNDRFSCDGIDNIDIPAETKIRAQPTVNAFYNTFPLQKTGQKGRTDTVLKF